MSGLGDALNTTLVRISEVIDEEDLQRMKFKCDFIMKRQRENIKTPLDLFQALQERGKLETTNTAFLVELLRTCCSGKVDGLNILSEYYQHAGNPQVLQPLQNGIPQPHYHVPTQAQYGGGQNMACAGMQQRGKSVNIFLFVFVITFIYCFIVVLTEVNNFKHVT